MSMLVSRGQRSATPAPPMVDAAGRPIHGGSFCVPPLVQGGSMHVPQGHLLPGVGTMLAPGPPFAGQGGSMHVPQGQRPPMMVNGPPFAGHGGSMHVPQGQRQPGPPMMDNGRVPPPDANGRVDLCQGLPDPETIRRQKETYAQDLEEQLKRGVVLLNEAHKEQTELLHGAANQEKHRYNLAMDQQVKQQELVLSQQYNEQLMKLQQAAQQQRAELEQQACGLTLEYQQRKVQEEFMVQQGEIQKQHQDAQSRLAEDMDKLGPSRLPTTPGNSFSVPQHGGGASMAAYAAPPIPAMVAACLPPGGNVLPYVPPGGVPSPYAMGSSFSVPKPATSSFSVPKPVGSVGAAPMITTAYGMVPQAPGGQFTQRRSASPLPFGRQPVNFISRPS